MYEYIKGTLIDSTPSKAIIETQGLGFCLLIPFNHFAKLPAKGSPITLFTSFVVREDSQKLFGFLTSQERDLFENLIEISGVGPKTALCLIGHMEMDHLLSALSQGNTQILCKIPGIGKKTAERLMVEMRDKMKKWTGTSSQGQLQGGTPEEDSLISDAISALINLGYNPSQAQKSVKNAFAKMGKEAELAGLITAALRL